VQLTIGKLEEYSVYRRQLGFLPWVVVSGRYSIPITKEILYPALKKLVTKEVLLAVNIFDLSTNPVLKRIQEVNLDTIVVFEENNQLEQVSDRLFHDTKAVYETNTPLWRLLVIDGGYELVWAFDHGPFDGNCGPKFHIGLANALDPSVKSLDSTIAIPQTTEIPPALESLVDLRPSMWFMAKILYKEFVSPSPPTPKEVPPPSVPPKNKTVYATISEGVVSKVLAKCHQLGVSLTAVLHTALIQACLKHFEEFDPTVNEFLFACPVNARRYMSKPDSASLFGNYVLTYDYNASPLIASHDVLSSQNFSTSLSTVFNNELKEAVADGRQLRYGIGALGYVNIREYIGNTTKKPCRRVTAEVSNLGNITPPESKVELIQLAFAQASNSAGAPYVLNAVGVKGRSLTLSLSVATDDFATARTLLASVQAIISGWIE
jgi:hypothetical protein